MATLILSAVGRLVGGSIGGAVGAVLGQTIDNRLFAPKGRQGPRLADLAVQSSTYGTALPRLFGRTRVAGSVIWATDLVEDRRKVSSGKGKPKQTLYSYSANFAVALSARPIARIGRIWADGKLLRGEAGDFKTATTFRLHPGGEDQAVDPLIAAAEGAGQAPAYRGLAYAVFEDFQLADYGNRIPSLSFEVIADEGDVSIGAILIDAARGALDADCPSRVDGMAVSGDTAAGLVQMISGVIPLIGSTSGSKMRISEAALAGPAIFVNDLGASTGELARMRYEHERRPLSNLAGRHVVAYHDVSRDYQPGAQSLYRPDLGPSQAQSEFAATLSAGRAKQLIEAKVAHDVAASEELRISLPPRYFALTAGVQIAVLGISGKWLVAESQVEQMAIKLVLRRLPAPASISASGDAGRAVSQNDALHGPTILRLIETPWLGSGTSAAPSVFAVAAGPLPGWRQAALLQSDDGGLSFQEIGATAAPAIFGSATSVLGSASPAGFDRKNDVVISLLHGAMALASVSEAALIGGQNLALLGSELIQFASAERLTATSYRLSHLLRGRRGTEWAIGSHGLAENFTLIDRDSLLPIAFAPGAEVRLLASGIGDVDAVSAILAPTGLAVQPLAPVHLRAHIMPSGDTRFAWTRRSRDGWTWLDAIDAPLAEENELYAVTTAPNIGPTRASESLQPEWIYSAAQKAADLAQGATSLTLTVAQIGTFGRSRTAAISLPLT